MCETCTHGVTDRQILNPVSSSQVLSQVSFSGFKLPLGLVLVLFLSSQAVLRSPAASRAPLTRMSIPKDIGLILGNGRCPHNPQLISSHNLEKRHFGERQWHSPVCEPEQERSKWAPYQSERRKLSSCCGCFHPGKLIHICSLLPPRASPGVGTMQGQWRSLGVPWRPQRHGGMAVTASVSCAESRAGQGEGTGTAGRARPELQHQQLLRAREKEHRIDPPKRIHRILYNSACNTCCGSPSPGCQGPSLKGPGATGRVQPFSVALSDCRDLCTLN